MMFPAMIAPLALVVFTACGVDPVFKYQAPSKNFPGGRFEVSRVSPNTIMRLEDKSALKKTLFVGVNAEIALLGTHGVTGDTVWFVPRFPPEPGVDHIIRFAPPGGSRGETLVWGWKPFPRETPVPTVAAFYPSTETIPENILRFYLQFSQPMKRGQVSGRVRVLDDKGKGIELPFLELDEELWDAGQTRLTLLVDPGRIKRGVKPLEDVGPVFESGKSYTLEVDGAFEDDAGKPLGKPFRKSLKAGPAIRERIQPMAWKILPPANRNGILEVQLDRPLDQALLLRQLKVQNSSGAPVEGVWDVPFGEKLARFRPYQPWPGGTCRLVPGGNLEDCAGNRTDRVFDAPGGEKPVDPVTHLVFPVPGK